MKQQPALVSVVIPVYNVQFYLKTCIQSLLDQTYQNLEIILIDDGSTDESSKICDLYSNDSRFIVRHISNGGQGAARNLGMSLCSGKYVIFVDSDDVCSPHLIEKLIEEKNKCGSDLVISGYSIFDSNKIIEKSHYIERTYEGSEKDLCLQRLLGNYKNDFLLPSVWASIFDVSIINSNNISFPDCKYSEDLIFKYLYIMKAKKISVINDNLYYWRMNQDSVTRGYKSNKLEIVISENKTVKQFLVNQKAPKKHFQRLYRYLLMNIRSCMCQEKNNPNSTSFFEKNKVVRNICSEQYVQQQIREFGYIDFDIKRKFFVFLVKKKLAIILTTLLKFNLL